MYSPNEGQLRGYVRGFENNAQAVLLWLQGDSLIDILEFIRPHLETAGTRSKGYRLDIPNDDAS